MKNNYSPMLSHNGTKHDLTKEGHIFEPKLDGTRARAIVNKTIVLLNRRNRNITHRYPEFDFRKHINAKTCVLDGEIIVYDAHGNPDFSLLAQRDQREHEAGILRLSKTLPATYVVFDILMKDGKNLTELPLLERKKILNQTIKSDTNHLEKIFYTTNGPGLWKEIEKRNLEGVITKEIKGHYYAGRRSSTWLKIKTFKTIECVIIGFTQEKRIISALALGMYDKGTLRYVGRVGTGFSEQFLAQFYEQIKHKTVAKPPVEYKGHRVIIWIKQTIIAEIKYLQITKDSKLRAPVFLRLRTDKSPHECTLPKS